MFCTLELAGFSKILCASCRNCFLVICTWDLLLTFLKQVGMQWASSSNFYMPNNGYAYNVNNWNITRRERYCSSGKFTEKCVEWWAEWWMCWNYCTWTNVKWLESGKIWHGAAVLESSIMDWLQKRWLILCNSGRLMLLNCVHLLLMRQDLVCGLVSKIYSISRNLKLRNESLNRHMLHIFPTAAIC